MGVPKEVTHDRGLNADKSDEDWRAFEVEGNWTQGELVVVEGMLMMLDGGNVC